MQWPTGLALSPLDDTLHFIDDRVIFKLTNDLKVKIVAGIPLHCRTGDNNERDSKDKQRNPKKVKLDSCGLIILTGRFGSCMLAFVCG